MPITKSAAEFIETVGFEQLPAEAIRIARRCLLDGAGLFVGGSAEDSVRILAEDAIATGGREDAQLLGHAGVRVPAPAAARVLGAAGHALDWDDTQMTDDPEHSYGLLTHPTIPPYAAALATSQMLMASTAVDSYWLSQPDSKWNARFPNGCIPITI
ncbi:MAG: MmgE/PrpD family protein [Gammaproteobacteria bacterium]|nr:MmgE/PrpD family protein [Gammaproteobacteria bacterium]